MNKKQSKFFLLFSSILLIASCGLTLLVGINQNHTEMFIGRAQTGNVCQHTSVGHHERLEPTTESNGHIEYWCCCACHHSFDHAPTPGDDNYLQNTFYFDPCDPMDDRHIDKLVSGDEIVFGTNVGLENETQMKFLRYESATVNFNISTYSACGHNKLATGPIRVGGSSTNGHMVLNLEDGLLCTGITVYAATMSEDAACNLTVNGETKTLHTTENNDYDFTIPYTFEFSETASLDIRNVIHTGRCLISKLVFNISNQEEL